MPDLQSIPVGATRTYRREDAVMEVCRDTKFIVAYRQGGRAGVWIETTIPHLEKLMCEGWEADTVKVPAELAEVNGK